mmetsp:Transcript_21363/g.48191  ORF Transcript_21363/g.48191 Transcript_21363/m.48191 type:complete len:430 (+) Transcript_21363:79-1368(+)
MKLIKRSINEKNGAGLAKLRAEEPEDMWHTFHLVGVGDRVRTTTLRKVVRESSTGSTTSSKLKITLTIEVQRVSFDAEACTLHLSGVNVEESEHVKLGGAHTVHLELHRDFVLEKECWDQVVLDRLAESLDPSRSAEVCCIALEPGLAHLCLISGHMTLTRAKLETAIPKKRAGASSHAKAVERFYSKLHEAVLRHVDFTQIKCVLVGGPGFCAADFLKSLFEAAVRQGDRPIIENKSKFLLCHASSGHKRAVGEMLASEETASRLLETRVFQDVRALGNFTKMLADDPDRAYYGYNHCVKADELLAIETLLVTDTLFKACDTATRLKYVALTESVREHGGVVRVFSSLHVSGEQLAQVSGIAAVLRFPLPEEAILGEEEEDTGESDEEDAGDSMGASSALGAQGRAVFECAARGASAEPVGHWGDSFG